jgi:hypothetical protein
MLAALSLVAIRLCSEDPRLMHAAFYVRGRAQDFYLHTKKGLSYIRIPAAPKAPLPFQNASYFKIYVPEISQG